MNKKNPGGYALSGEERERLTLIRSWLIILVVFIHSYGTGTEVRFESGSMQLVIPAWLQLFKFTVSRVIAGSAIPAYFFLSSFFLYRKSFSWQENMKKKARTIAVPYLIMNTFWIAVYFVCQHINALKNFFANADKVIARWGAADWLFAYIGDPSRGYPMLYPLWFLRDLLVLNLLAVFFLCFVRRWKRISLTVFLLLWLFCPGTHLFFLSIQAVCFWGLGCWTARYLPVSRESRIPSPVLFCGYILLVLLSVLTRSYETVFHRIIFRLCSLTGMLFLYRFGTRPADHGQKKIQLLLSRYSFPIYLFHEMALTMLRKICFKIFPATPAFQLAEYVGIPAVIITGCLVFSIILANYLPRLYALLTGGRR